MATRIEPNSSSSFELITDENSGVDDTTSSVAQHALEFYRTALGMLSYGCYRAGLLINWIKTSAAGLLGALTFRIYTLAQTAGGWIQTKIQLILGIMSYGIYHTSIAIKESVLSAARKTGKFVKENWRYIIAYIIAWTVVIVSAGALYGFSKVALPLTIGFGCGIAFGGFTGILTCKIFGKEGASIFGGVSTIWDLLNSWINTIDENGTRQLVLAVAVTVLLAASVIYPYGFGAIWGILVGNQVITKIGQERRLGEERHIESLPELKRKIMELQAKVDAALPEGVDLDAQ